MTAIPLSRSDTLVVTGGDDGALAFTRITSSDEHPGHPPSFSTMLIPKAHASAINAITHFSGHNLDGYCFATSSSDQKIKVWYLSVDLDEPGVTGFKIVRKQDVYTSVADVSCLDIFENDKGKVELIVAGIGMESWGFGESGLLSLG